MNDDDDYVEVELDGVEGPITSTYGVIVLDPTQMVDGTTYIIAIEDGRRFSFRSVDGLVEMIPVVGGDKYVSE